MDGSLQGAYLLGANLTGVRLARANLHGAILDGVAFSEDTKLPDGAKWPPGTDMARFTDPKHPAFWRSDDPDSPAYRGGDD